MNSNEIKTQIKATRKEMKDNGVRVISCFNGGLTGSESYYNTLLFKLKTELLKSEKAA